MMLVYNLPQTGAIFDRFGGIAGSAYFIGGLGTTALTSGDGHSRGADPFRTWFCGSEPMLAIFKFTERPTWNPF